MSAPHAFRSWKSVLALVLALALVWSGCGGSSEGVTPTPLSKAQFLKLGNAICGQADHRINTKFERYSRRHLSGGRSPSDLSYARATARIVLPHVEGEISEIRKLQAPVRDERRVGEIIAAFEAGVEMGKRNPLTLAGSGRFAFTKAHALAVDFGLIRCAVG